MPQAEPHHTPIPSRRDVIRSGGKVAAAAAIGGAGPAAAMPSLAGDDAEILALKREIDRLVAAGDAIPDDDAAGPFYSKATELGRRIAELRATTIQALAVKLRLAAESGLDLSLDGYPGRHITTVLADAERMAQEARA